MRVLGLLTGRNCGVFIVAVLVSTAVALAGCGSGNDAGSSDDTPSRSLTKGQFVSRANQICVQGLKEKDNEVQQTLEQISLEEREHPSNLTFETLAKDALLPSYKRITRQLAALPAPAGDEEEVQALISKLEAGIAKAEDNLVGLSRSNPFEDATVTAKSYGIEGCVF